VYKWFRVLEYYWLFKYLTDRKTLFLKLLPIGLSVSVIWTSVLVIWQFVLQSSAGGLWYWLGERTFVLNTPGIAKVSLVTGQMLRPYATFPHPNALAGFLLMAGVILYSFYRHFGLKLKNASPDSLLLLRITIILTLIIIPMTFSKTAIVLEVMLLGLLLISRIKSKLMYLILLLPLIVYPLLPTSPESVSQRLALNKIAFEVIKNYWITGTGLGNFVLTVPTLRQPVHNIYLLVIAELGLPFFIILSYMIIKLLRRKSIIDYWIMIIPMVIGLADHYWLTLHQTSLLLVIVSALGTITTYATKNPL